MRRNFHRIRQISIIVVAHALGMELTKTGVDTFNMREGEHITSLTIFLKTNSFYRFSGKDAGGVQGGSVIDLVRHIRGCSVREAADFLSSHFL